MKLPGLFQKGKHVLKVTKDDTFRQLIGAPEKWPEETASYYFGKCS